MSIQNLNVPRLAKICAIPGAPGFEKDIRNHVKTLVSPHCDKVYEDNMGNLIAIKRGASSEKRAMVAAHLDEIGFIVKHIDKKGFIHFHPLGGFDPKTLTAQRVIVHGKEDVIGVMGSKPIHVMSPEERGKAPKLSDFFIDTGLPSEKVHDLISVGDSITRERELITMGIVLTVNLLTIVFLSSPLWRRLKSSMDKLCPMMYTASLQYRRRLAYGVRL